MKWVDRLERRLGWLAVPHLPVVLMTGQVIVLLLWFIQGAAWTQEVFSIQPAKIAQGDWWRLLIIPFEPQWPGWFGVFDAVIGTSAFFLMSSSLERHWGSFRFTFFILLGWLLNSLLMICVMPFATNEMVLNALFVRMTVYFAFAWTWPEFEFSLYFILPVKVKYLALALAIYPIAAIGNGLMNFRQGGWFVVLVVLVNIGNFLAYFGMDIVRGIGRTHRRYSMLGAEAAERRAIRHTCAACGANNLTHPDLEFRYCTQCVGTPGYCEHHIRNHEHKLIAAASKT